MQVQWETWEQDIAKLKGEILELENDQAELENLLDCEGNYYINNNNNNITTFNHSPFYIHSKLYIENNLMNIKSAKGLMNLTIAYKACSATRKITWAMGCKASTIITKIS